MNLLAGLQHDLRRAVDEAERKSLRRIAAVGVSNMLVFGVSVMLLPPRGPATSLERAWLGTASALVFTLVHLCVYLIWCPRAQVRRRQAEVLADPGAAARHASEDRKVRLSVLGGCVLIALVIAAIWVFR